MGRPWAAAAAAAEGVNNSQTSSFPLSFFIPYVYRIAPGCLRHICNGKEEGKEEHMSLKKTSEKGSIQKASFVCCPHVPGPPPRFVSQTHVLCVRKHFLLKRMCIYLRMLGLLARGIFKAAAVMTGQFPRIIFHIFTIANWPLFPNCS